MKRRKKWFRIERAKRKRMRILIRDKPVFGINSHPLPRARRREDNRPIRHIHIYRSKRHIPLDRKYIGYVISDFRKRIGRKRKKNKEDQR